MSDISKSLGSVTKWSGKYAFFTIIIALVLTAVTISLADPSFNNYNLTAVNSVTEEFTVNGVKDVQIFFSTDDGSMVEFTLEKLGYFNQVTNETSDFSSSENEIILTTEIISTIDNNLYRIIELQEGVYRLTVNKTYGGNFSVFMGHANFNLGLITASVIMYAIFGIAFSIFTTVLPFWIIAAIVSSTNKPIQEKPTYSAQSTGPRTETQNTSTSDRQTQPPQREPHTVRSSSSTIDMFSGTPFEKLTKKNWVWIAIGTVLFFIFLTNPFNSGPVLFIALIIFGGVGYSYFEREKTKDRLTILLRSYPKASLAFIAEQLDKEEDHIIEALRIMILDEGYPIRLDLVNRTVSKVGSFPVKHTRSPQRENSVGSTEFQSSVKQQTITVDESTEEDRVTSQEDTVTDVEENETIGSINEPWAYCQACGEGLKKEVKYCYSCGARQYK